MYGCEKWRTVVRCASKSLLSEYFAKRSLLPGPQGNEMKRAAYVAACQLSEPGKRATVEDELNHIYAFVKSPSCLERTLEDAETKSIDLSTLKDLGTGYDRALYLCLNHRDLWENAVSFLNVDALPKQVWCRCAGLPRMSPKTSEQAQRCLGADIAAYYREHQHCAQYWDTEQRNRSEALHVFFVYFSDTPDFSEIWNEHGERTEILQTNVRNAVFYYDSLTGALDTFCCGGIAVARELQRIFCRDILNYELTNAQILKYGFQLNHLKFRRNEPQPVPLAGVMAVNITSMTLAYADMEMKHRHRIPHNGQNTNGLFYDKIEQYANAIGMPLEMFSVQKVEMVLTVEVNGVRSKLKLLLTRNSCTLRNYSDAVRMAGEQFLQANGIDIQTKLL